MASLFTQQVGFCVEYYDPVASLIKKFVLTQFQDGKLQMVRFKRMFNSTSWLGLSVNTRVLTNVLC